MKRIHFIAIGGSAMHNLALALHAKGYIVTGSDDEIFEPARSRLAAAGLLPESEGWYPSRLDAMPDAVILGMHAKADNPELLRAGELRIPVFSYPEYLYEQSKDKTRIVIGGSHGKTTITAMILHALRHAGIETGFMVGARLPGFDIMVGLSDTAPYMVFEGDEYLTSPIDPRPKFHLYRPHLALISGIAWDHINVFPEFSGYVDQFRQFIRLTEAGGTVFYAAGDEVLAALCSESFPHVNLKSYSYPSYRVEGEQTLVIHEGEAFPLQVFGRHNLLNAAGAAAICDMLSVGRRDFWQAMTTFRGAANRLECLAKSDTTAVYKDFAHAPSKVKATVQAVREQYPGRKLVACLELHTYSSLSRQFLSQYKGSLEHADTAMVYYNPHALQIKRLPPVDPDDIDAGFAKPQLLVFNDSDGLKQSLLSLDYRNSVLLLMSSGNFDGMNLDSIAASVTGNNI
ncbi:MAG TPA: Mur ligase domain-containing protein [Bacteroidales bacterium]|nr:Mur ligase domain-containing protein [Bacteroidales bacterium]HSA44049.1 Mur ligase domain-containing protein [Bacteroidales bacterium]